MRRPFTRRGFSLIELLVVIAIIGILSGITITSLNSARAKGRDAERISELKQMQLALALYYDACGRSYPSANSTTNGNVVATSSNLGCPPNGTTLANFISPPWPPTVPGSGDFAIYRYAFTTSGSLNVDYVLRAKLENNGNAVLRDDVDGSVFGVDCEDSGNFYCIRP